MAKILFLVQLLQLAVVEAAQNMKMEVLVVQAVVVGNGIVLPGLTLEALEHQDKDLLAARVILLHTMLIHKRLAAVVEVVQAELEPILLLEFTVKVTVVQDCVQQ
jgi:hypothetical protein